MISVCIVVFMIYMHLRLYCAQRNIAEGIVAKDRCSLDALAGAVLLSIPASYLFCVIVYVDLTKLNLT